MDLFGFGVDWRRFQADQSNESSDIGSTSLYVQRVGRSLSLRLRHRTEIVMQQFVQAVKRLRIHRQVHRATLGYEADGRHSRITIAIKQVLMNIDHLNLLRMRAERLDRQVAKFVDDLLALDAG
jgi:hypothetical protein